MSIQQPQATDLLNSPSHSKLHRVLASDSSAPDESLVADASGNIGIGTITPGTGLLYGALNTKLHISNSSLAILAIQATSGSALCYVESGTGNAIMALADTSTTSNFRILDILSSGGKMVFRRLTDAYSSALANGMCLDYTNDNTGRLGLGTTTPGTKFNIVDTEDFRMGHTGGSGELLAGFAFYVADNSAKHLINLGNGSGAVGGTYQVAYYSVASLGFLSAFEIANVASGYGTMTLMRTGGSIYTGAKFSQYGGVPTTGWGVPAIYGTGRATAQTAAAASVATYTVGAADGSFIVSANVNITTFAVGTFNVTVTYTDETNTSQTLKLNFSSLTGTIGIALAAAGPFEGIPAVIRCKASTAITIQTAGTFTSLTYNVEGSITQTS